MSQCDLHTSLPWPIVRPSESRTVLLGANFANKKDAKKQQTLDNRLLQATSIDGLHDVDRLRAYRDSLASGHVILSARSRCSPVYISVTMSSGMVP